MKTVFKHQFTMYPKGISSSPEYKCEEFGILADRPTTIVLDTPWATVVSKYAPAFYGDLVLDQGVLDTGDLNISLRGGFQFTLYATQKHSADDIKTMIKAAIEAHVRKQFSHLLDADLSAVKD